MERQSSMELVSLGIDFGNRTADVFCCNISAENSAHQLDKKYFTINPQVHINSINHLLHLVKLALKSSKDLPFVSGIIFQVQINCKTIIMVKMANTVPAPMESNK